MLRRWRLLGILLPGLAFLSTLFLHAYLGTYSRFIADDYCSAGMAKRFGVLRAVWYWYLNWTGRYSASALDAAFGLLGPAVTPFVPALVILLWLAVLTWTAALLIQGQSKIRLHESLGLALAVLFLTLILSPNVPQSLYWGQGMRSIVPPLILGLVYLDLFLLLKSGALPGKWPPLWPILGFLLAFFMGGLNETFTALEVSLFIFSLVLAVLARPEGLRRNAIAFLAAGLAGACLALLVVVIAPGNAFRQAFYPPPPSLAGILGISLAGFLRFLSASFSQVDRLSGTLAVIGLSIFIGMQFPAARPPIRFMPLILGAAIAFVFVCFLPAAYGLSDVPPDRTLMMPAYLIALAVVCIGFIFGGFLGSAAKGATWRTAIEIGILLFAALSCFTSVFITDRRLLVSRREYVDYAANWGRMNATILEARSQGAALVQIQTMQNWADLNEPNDNPKFWVNVCFREYYGIEVLAETQP